MHRHSLFSCFSCHKRCNGVKVTKFETPTRECTSSLEDLRTVTELAGGRKIGTKQNDREGSARETLSLSTTSQLPGFGDGTSASLGGWSAAQPPESMDISKVNLVASEDSVSLIRPILGEISRSSDLSDECYERLETLVLRLERLAGIRSTNVDEGLSAFQLVISETLPHYMALSATLSSEAQRQSEFVKEAFDLVLNLIKLSTTYAKPSPGLLDEYLRPLSYKLLEVADFNPDVEPIRRHELVTVADSVIALGWCSCPTASQFVKEIREAANVYANKAFQYCYSSHSIHVDWIRSWMACLKGVQDVVDQYFRFGLCWIPNGPRAPTPPKSPRPFLKYEQSKFTTEQMVRCGKRSAPTLCSSPEGSGRSVSAACGDRSGEKNSTLLSEIPQARWQLRHVSKPDLY